MFVVGSSLSSNNSSAIHVSCTLYIDDSTVQNLKQNNFHKHEKQYCYIRSYYYSGYTFLTEFKLLNWLIWLIAKLVKSMSPLLLSSVFSFHRLIPRLLRSLIIWTSVLFLATLRSCGSLRTIFFSNESSHFYTNGQSYRLKQCAVNKRQH